MHGFEEALRLSVCKRLRRTPAHKETVYPGFSARGRQRLGIEYFYGFEDHGLPLGYFGEGEPPILANIVTTPVHGGDVSLRCEDNATPGTPQAYLVWVKGLMDGDEVTAGFWRYDTTPGGSPSCRIWGHWNDDDMDVNGYDHSAGGNSDCGPSEGWDYTEQTWTVADGHTGLIVEIRTYSNDGDVVWIDDLHVNAPGYAEVILPICSTATGEGSWSEVKALYCSPVSFQTEFGPPAAAEGLFSCLFGPDPWVDEREFDVKMLSIDGLMESRF